MKVVFWQSVPTTFTVGNDLPFVGIAKLEKKKKKSFESCDMLAQVLSCYVVGLCYSDLMFKNKIMHGRCTGRNPELLTVAKPATCHAHVNVLNCGCKIVPFTSFVTKLMAIHS